MENRSEILGVMAIWDGAARGRGFVLSGPAPAANWGCAASCRHPARAAAAAVGAELVDAAAYEAHRIALGVPSGGLDFVYGDAFPHEADMDQLHGVDFQKGCYVGQEVVSRMEHRGSARTRVVPVAFDGARARDRQRRDGGGKTGRHDGLGGGRPRSRAAAPRPGR